jgi:hypothetical protein
MGSILSNMPTPQGDSVDGKLAEEYRGRIHTRRVYSTLLPVIEGCCTVIIDERLTNTYNYNILVGSHKEDSLHLIPRLSARGLGLEYSFAVNHRFTSRVAFYKQYEELAREKSELQHLYRLIYVDKKDIVLAGPTLSNVSDADVTRATIIEMFHDMTNDFCPEQAIHAMLLFYGDEERLPWRR